MQDRQYGVERRPYIEEHQPRRPQQQFEIPATDSQGRSHADWRQREDPSPVFSSRHDSHTAGGPPDIKQEATALSDGLLHAVPFDMLCIARAMYPENTIAVRTDFMTVSAVFPHSQVTYI